MYYRVGMWLSNNRMFYVFHIFQLRLYICHHYNARGLKVGKFFRRLRFSVGNKSSLGCPVLLETIVLYTDSSLSLKDLPLWLSSLLVLDLFGGWCRGFTPPPVLRDLIQLLYGNFSLLSEYVSRTRKECPTANTATTIA